jgi:hypothetical protein
MPQGTYLRQQFDTARPGLRRSTRNNVTQQHDLCKRFNAPHQISRKELDHISGWQKLEKKKLKNMVVSNKMQLPVASATRDF